MESHIDRLFLDTIDTFQQLRDDYTAKYNIIGLQYTVLNCIELYGMLAGDRWGCSTIEALEIIKQRVDLAVINKDILCLYGPFTGERMWKGPPILPDNSDSQQVHEQVVGLLANETQINIEKKSYRLDD